MRTSYYVAGLATLALSTFNVACGSSASNGSPSTAEQGVIDAFVMSQFSTGYGSGQSKQSKMRINDTASFTFALNSTTQPCPVSGTLTLGGDANISIVTDAAGDSNSSFVFDLSSNYAACQSTGDDNNIYQVDTASPLSVTFSGQMSLTGVQTSSPTESGSFVGRVTCTSMTIKPVGGSGSLTGSIDMTYNMTVNASGFVTASYSGTEFGSSVNGSYSGQ